jgi:hypothetical protein
MGWNDHTDFELSEALQEVIDGEYLEQRTAALGIAKLVADWGTGILSAKQQRVYDKHVVPALVQMRRDQGRFESVHEFEE